MVRRPGLGQQGVQFARVQGSDVPTCPKALLDLKGCVGVALSHDLPQKLIYFIHLVPIEQLYLLLDLQLDRFQAGDVEPGRGVG